MSIPDTIDIGPVQRVRQGMELCHALQQLGPAVRACFGGAVPVVIDDVAADVKAWEEEEWSTRPEGDEDWTPPLLPAERLPLEGRLPWPDVWCEWREYRKTNGAGQFSGMLARERPFDEMIASLKEEGVGVAGFDQFTGVTSVVFAQCFRLPINVNGVGYVMPPSSIAWALDAAGEIIQSDFERRNQPVFLPTWHHDAHLECISADNAMRLIGDLRRWFYFMGLLAVPASRTPADGEGWRCDRLGPLQDSLDRRRPEDAARRCSRPRRRPRERAAAAYHTRPHRRFSQRRRPVREIQNAGVDADALPRQAVGGRGVQDVRGCRRQQR